MADNPAQPDAYRDSSGRGLECYLRPSVTVDVAVLTVPPGRDAGLCVVTVERAGRHRHGARQLPGTFLHADERLVDAALRALREKAGITGVRPQQLHVFDDLGRDDRGWVLSVAHLDVVPFAQVERALGGQVALEPVATASGLAFDHDEIVRSATEHVRREHLEHPDPFGILPEPFTLLDLQLLHEAVAGTTFFKDTFRRGMQRHLAETGETRDGVVGKPARLWVRRP